jgi:hypothetical protein
MRVILSICETPQWLHVQLQASTRTRQAWNDDSAKVLLQGLERSPLAAWDSRPRIRANALEQPEENGPPDTAPYFGCVESLHYWRRDPGDRRKVKVSKVSRARNQRGGVD